MRIRNGKSLASLFLATCNNGGNDRKKDPPFLEQQPTGGTVPSTTPLLPCQVNRSPWDVSSIVLAFFHLDRSAPGDVFREEEAIVSSDLSSPSIRTETIFIDESPLDFIVSSQTAQINPSSSPGKGKELPVARPKNEKRERKGTPCWVTRKGGYCKRKDGKGWTCRAEAKSGSSFCHHHLSQLRSYCSKKAAGGRSCKKPQFLSPKDEDSSDSHYYYYMGFGPERRQKKRNAGMPADPSAAGNTFGITDEEDSESERIETRRRRKRVKCRSLKSLL